MRLKLPRAGAQQRYYARSAAEIDRDRVFRFFYKGGEQQRVGAEGQALFFLYKTETVVDRGQRLVLFERYFHI